MFTINDYIKTSFENDTLVLEIRTFELKDYIEDIFIENYNFDILYEKSQLSKTSHFENIYFLHFDSSKSEEIEYALQSIDKEKMKEIVNEQNYQANGNFFCRCCGYNTLSEFPNGTYEICKICFWEDDMYQTENPTDEGGPNRVSLIQAKQNFEEFGACELDMKQYVRKITKNDIRKSNDRN